MRPAESNATLTPGEYISLSHARLDRCIQRAMDRKGAVAADAFAGLYISDQEAHALARAAQERPADLQPLEARPALNYFPERSLRERFSLTDLDIDILHACLAPLYDEKYVRLYGYLHDNVSRSAASLQLCYILFAEGSADRLHLLERLGPGGALRRNGLVVSENAGLAATQAILAAEPLATFLAGLTIAASGVASVRLPRRAADVNANASPLAFAALPLSESSAPDVWCVSGAAASGRLECIRQACDAHAWPLIEADLSELSGAREAEFDQRFRGVVLAARLYGAALVLRNIDAALDSPRRATLRRELSDISGIASVLTSALRPLATDPQMRAIFPTSRLFDMQISGPDYSARRKLWELHLPNELRTQGDPSLLAARFPFSEKEIQRVVRSAQDRLALPDGVVGSREFLYAACRSQRNSDLKDLAQKIESRWNWEDLVLPAEHIARLNEIEAYMRNVERVRSEWGHARSAPAGGASVLFCGDSGVGKTMAAGIIARELGVELYRVDLSRVINKYIGETEKNLARIFDAAAAASAGLFFDEADALFGKRTEVQDAHDRYANIETSYLLQRMEEHTGLCVLATNLRQNLDHAFARRLRFVVEFPFPDRALRLRMWRSMFPAATPLGSDIDFEFLAEKAPLAGGNIRNIALAASVMAAEAPPVRMEHVVLAIQREYEKLQKTFMRNEFSQYLQIGSAATHESNEANSSKLRMGRVASGRAAS